MHLHYPLLSSASAFNPKKHAFVLSAPPFIVFPLSKPPTALRSFLPRSSTDFRRSSSDQKCRPPPPLQPPLRSLACRCFKSIVSSKSTAPPPPVFFSSSPPLVAAIQTRRTTGSIKPPAPADHSLDSQLKTQTNRLPIADSADIWSTSSAAKACRCGPQIADILASEKQTTPKISRIHTSSCSSFSEFKHLYSIVQASVFLLHKLISRKSRNQNQIDNNPVCALIAFTLV